MQGQKSKAVPSTIAEGSLAAGCIILGIRCELEKLMLDRLGERMVGTSCAHDHNHNHDGSWSTCNTSCHALFLEIVDFVQFSSIIFRKMIVYNA